MKPSTPYQTAGSLQTKDNRIDTPVDLPHNLREETLFGQELYRLTDKVGEIEKLISTMSDRLAPVTRPIGPQVTSVPITPDTGVPLLDTLGALRTRLHNTVDIGNDILERLAI